MRHRTDRKHSRKRLDDAELDARLAGIRNAWSEQQLECTRLMARDADTFTHRELYDFYVNATTLVHSYTWACQLPGELALVTDNNIIQDFKHQNSPKQGNRRARALAFAAFSGFVREWSDRKTHIAISPVVIYEHCGRVVPDLARLEIALAEIRSLLGCTGMDIRALHFESVAELRVALEAVHHDSVSLRDFAQSIHLRSWKRDLRADFGWKIPMSIAAEELAKERVALKYFSPDCVSRVFTAVVEEEIATQSSAPGVNAIRSGETTRKLARLNGIQKDIIKGKISGLGDLELFDGCRLGAQFHRPAETVFVGQTFDGDLRDILAETSAFVVSKSMVVGACETETKAMVEFMAHALTGGDPMPEHTARLEAIRPAVDSFLCALGDVCAASERRLMQDRR